MNHDWMGRALELAQKAALAGEVPVGAVLIRNRQIIAQDYNRVEERADPTAHAELLVIRSGLKVLGTASLEDCALYVTLEPCAMCAGAISWSRLGRVFYGAYDPKSGGVEHGARVFDHPTCHHRPDIYGGLREGESKILLKNFFRSLRF